jgi:hypothetical protein
VSSTINRLARYEPSTLDPGPALPRWPEDDGGRYASPATRVETPLAADELRIGVFLDHRLPRDITPAARHAFLATAWRKALAGTPGLAGQLGRLHADPDQFDLQAVSIRQTYFPTAGPAAAEVWTHGVVAASHHPCYREFVWTGPVHLAAADRTYEVLVTVLVLGS